MAKRRRRSFRSGARRVGRRFRRGAVKVSTMTKITNTFALLIGASPAIVLAKNDLLEGGFDFNRFGHDMAYGYSAGLTSGHFDQAAALQYYGPIVGAIAFKKAFSWLKKHAGKTLLG